MTFLDTSAPGRLLVTDVGSAEILALLREAGRLNVPNAWVRTADAIHIITATRLEQTDFVTYDRVQARGAEAMGFVVRSPGLDDGRWR